MTLCLCCSLWPPSHLESSPIPLSLSKSSPSSRSSLSRALHLTLHSAFPSNTAFAHCPNGSYLSMSYRSHRGVRQGVSSTGGGALGSQLWHLLLERPLAATKHLSPTYKMGMIMTYKFATRSKWDDSCEVLKSTLCTQWVPNNRNCSDYWMLFRTVFWTCPMSPSRFNHWEQGLCPFHFFGYLQPHSHSREVPSA